jgi:hypothetical protein
MLHCSMKVGIVTFHFAHSFGAVLQSTALVQHLRQRGHDARILDRRSPRLPILDPWTSPRKAAKNLLLLWHYQSLNTQARRILEFVLKHQKLTERYDDVADAVARWPTMDAYVAGSDQVWNVERRINPLFFLLPADPQRSQLISYAASFGTTSIPDSRKSEVSKALRRFHSISVREPSGATIVESLTGTRPAVLCDPVLLHGGSFYAPLEVPYPTPPEYILVLAVGVDQHLDHAISLAKRKLGLPVLHLLCGTPRHASRETDRAILDAGPAEYLYLVRNARLILTNSFHGHAFSIVLNRPFLSSPAMAGRNTRIESLLAMFHAGARDVSNGRIPTRNEWDALLDVDSETWLAIQESLRNDANAFLATALGEG